MTPSLRSCSLSDFSSVVPTCDVSALAARQDNRWRPGVAGSAHSEVFASAGDGAGAGLTLALARDAIQAVADQRSMDDGRIMWVQDRRAVRLSGRPYRHGLPQQWRDRLIYVEASSCEDALFALEEGLRCRELAFVIGEIAGNPRALTFTASRRLSLVSERYGVPLCLIRLDARPDLSSARMRWSVASDRSLAALWDRQAPGLPSWKAELFRSRSHAPGVWNLYEDAGQLRQSPQRQSHTAAKQQMVGNAFVRKRLIGADAIRNQAQLDLLQAAG